MAILVLDHAAVAAALPVRDCIAAMADALTTVAHGDAVLPLRTLLPLPVGSARLALMPASLGTPPVFGVKVIAWFPSNHGTPYDSHQGAVLLFEAEHGRLLAVLDATAVTAIRTAAVSAVATRELSRRDATALALLGCGVQAVTHLDALLAVRPLTTVRVFSPDEAARTAFAAAAAARHGIAVAASATARDAVAGAHVVCTVTSSNDPVLERGWLAPGAHINAVGACIPSARELDSDTVAAARLYVDRRESALAEAGDLLIPMREGRFGASHIVGELGEVLAGRVAGRRDDSELTVFKSLGLAVEDVAAARQAYLTARSAGLGTIVSFGGLRAGREP